MFIPTSVMELSFRPTEECKELDGKTGAGNDVTVIY